MWQAIAIIEGIFERVLADLGCDGSGVVLLRASGDEDRGNDCKRAGTGGEDAGLRLVGQLMEHVVPSLPEMVSGSPRCAHVRSCSQQFLLRQGRQLGFDQDEARSVTIAISAFDD